MLLLLLLDYVDYSGIVRVILQAYFLLGRGGAQTSSIRACSPPSLSSQTYIAVPHGIFKTRLGFVLYLQYVRSVP